MRFLFLSIVYGALVPIPSQGQDVTAIRTDNLCEDCRISVEHVVTLGKAEDPISPTWFSHVAIDDSGFFFVGPTYAPGEIAVYSPGGRFIRSLGRQGEGPGEFEGIRLVRITGGDTLHVFSQWRHTVMSIAGDVIETSPFSVTSREAFILGDGRILASAIIPTPDQIGFPAHILGADGRPALSFGNDPRSAQGDVYGGTHRRVSFSGGDEVWITPLGEYRIELWDTAGVHLRTFVRNPPWFNPWVRDILGEPFRAKPNPKMLSVHRDRDGRAWVFARVPDQNWRLGHSPPAYGLVYDTVVDIFDPSTGELIISQRFNAPDQLFNWFLSEDLVYSVGISPLGVERIYVWRMQLTYPDQKGG
jgi:hypothetical protein